MAFTELETLDAYCRKTLLRSSRYHERWGALVEQAHRTLQDPTIWDFEWAPSELDLGVAAAPPVYAASIAAEQRRAWSHLQWTLDYITVAQGEQQVIVMNGLAAKRFRTVCPSVCELQDRESDEEADHVAGFFAIKDAVQERYFPRGYRLQVQATSGTSSGRLNRSLRWLIGQGADRIFGSNFPTLFFLTRGMKSHTFKPFEIAYSRHERSHPAIRELSVMHGWDESRHIATAQHLSRLSAPLLGAAPQENQLLFKMAMQRLWPRDRLVQYRVDFWRRCLSDSAVFATVPAEERALLLQHVATNIERSVRRLHPLQESMVRKSNRRIVEECGLSPRLKREFVGFLRSDPSQCAVVESVRVPA